MKPPCLFLVVLLTGCASSGDHYLSAREKQPEPFDGKALLAEYVEQNNLGQRMEVLSAKQRDVYAASYDGRRETIKTLDYRGQVDNVVLARYSLEDPDGVSKSGYVAFEVEHGKIDFILSTEGRKAGYRHQAVAGQAADIATTGIGLAAGLTEANPVAGAVIDAGGVPALGVLKIGAGYVAERYSLEACYGASPVSAAVGWGAAAMNLAVLVFPPAALLGIPIAAAMWPDRDELFWSCVPPQAETLLL